jgi:starch phosphorylase
VVTLDKNGPLGYTVRVLPRHPGLAWSAELGLPAVPAHTLGLTTGVLR